MTKKQTPTQIEGAKVRDHVTAEVAGATAKLATQAGNNHRDTRSELRKIAQHLKDLNARADAPTDKVLEAVAESKESPVWVFVAALVFGFLGWWVRGMM